MACPHRPGRRLLKAATTLAVTLPEPSHPRLVRKCWRLKPPTIYTYTCMYVRVCVCMFVHVYVYVYVNMHSYIYTCISNSAFTLAPGRHTPFTSTTVPKGVCAPSRCSTLAHARCKGSMPSSSSGSCSFSRASCHSGDAFTRRRKCSRTSKATCSASPPRPSRAAK